MAKTQQEILAEADAQKQAATNLIPKFESEADLDRYWTGIRMREAEEDKAREEQRNKRRLAARSLGDLGQAFIDMIKGAEGAIVSPRSVEQQYQALDERQRQIYDNYRARTDALRQQQLERERIRQAEAAKADLAREGYAAKLQEAQMRLQGQQAQNASRERAAAIRAGRQFKSEDKYVIDFGDGLKKSYRDNTKEGQNVYAAIFNYMLKSGIIPTSRFTDAKGNVRYPKTQQEVDVLVREFLSDAMRNHKFKMDILNIVYGEGNPYTQYIRQQIQNGINRNKTQIGLQAAPSAQPVQPQRPTNTSGGWKPGSINEDNSDLV